MIHQLNKNLSVANHYLAEIRDLNIQKDPLRFRKNMERLAEILAYEVSKTFEYRDIEVETPLGISQEKKCVEHIVLATILRAGLSMHAGLLNTFDQASNAFISAYRQHHKDGSFEINLEYISSPEIEGSILLLCDPMLATGASMDATLKELYKIGRPKKTHLITAIASQYGIEYINRLYPEVDIWTGDIDEELTAKSYIVPGLGDAGDLSYGPKIQE